MNVKDAPGGAVEKAGGARAASREEAGAREKLTDAVSVWRQRRTISLAEASVAPSGVQARAVTALVCPSRTAVQVLSVRRQRRTVLSPLGEARVLPSGVQARAVTTLVWPLRTAVQVLS